jgi:PsbP
VLITLFSIFISQIIYLLPLVSPSNLLAQDNITAESILPEDKISISSRFSNQSADLPLQPILSPYENSTNGIKTYENPEWGISMQYPSNWRATTSGLTDYIDLIAFYSPPQNITDLSAARLKISVIDYTQNISLPEYKNFALTLLNQSRQFRLVDSSEAVIGGHPSYIVQIAYKPENGPITLNSLNIWTSVGNKLYLVTYDGEESEFNRYRSEVSTMLETLRIEN